MLPKAGPFTPGPGQGESELHHGQNPPFSPHGEEHFLGKATEVFTKSTSRSRKHTR